MPKTSSPQRDNDAANRTAHKSTRVAAVRGFLIGTLGQLAAAPIIGLLAGFLLLVGGIFLAVAWQAGPRALIDASHYSTFTVKADGRIVESWTAIEFDPSVLPPGKLNWQPYSKISPCVVVEYSGDWNSAIRRAFCGNRFQFRDDFRFDDWHTMAPGVPFAFARDKNGFDQEEIRFEKTALDWLSKNAPYDTFAMSKPPPTTALAALKEHFDQPLAVAMASWSTPFPPYPLLYDPKFPDQAMPAKYVEDRRDSFAWGVMIMTALLAIPGFLVWQLGIRFLTGQSGAILWIVSIVPLLALPWWNDLLPQIVRRANSNWADIVTDMLDDIDRVTRFTASAPNDALLVDGERVVWHVESGAYADSFGRISFAIPQPLPKSADDALIALETQTSDSVAKLDSPDRAALFKRLRQQNDAGLDKVQRVFWKAAEDTLRDANADRAAHNAARNFLVFASGGHFAEDQLDKIEVAPR